MNKKLKKYEIAGILFTITVGSLLHFIYYWSGNNMIVSLFSAVNESTWEHLKLLFFPYASYSIFEYFVIGHDYRNFIAAKVLGVIVGLISIPIVFYTYTFILGDNYVILDILTFLIGVIVSYLFSWYVLKHKSISCNRVSMIILVFLIMLFFVFTFKPPVTKLFMDPLTRTYGIP